MTRAELLALPLKTPVRIRVGPQTWEGTIYSRSGSVVMVRLVTPRGHSWGTHRGQAGRRDLHPARSTTGPFRRTRNMIPQVNATDPRTAGAIRKQLEERAAEYRQGIEQLAVRLDEVDAMLDLLPAEEDEGEAAPRVQQPRNPAVWRERATLLANILANGPLHFGAIREALEARKSPWSDSTMNSTLQTFGPRAVRAGERWFHKAEGGWALTQAGRVELLAGAATVGEKPAAEVETTREVPGEGADGR